ncbi:MAG TPA: pyridoxamine 5'-phosphate oxidase family protein [Pseudonocardiaceae bacterium]|nr:pyridoxamine 5'-phosphate oxidase family protein [Pseudonocardiaceae bacterium]
MSRPALSPTRRSTPRRHPERARTDRSELDAVLDAGLVCHLGLVMDGAPVVLPTAYGRDGDTLYVHGSSGASSLLAARPETDACVTVSLLDGIVYARAAFSHSINYRSAVIHGKVRIVDEPDEKVHGLAVVTEHLAPGSWDYTRQPNKRELAKTSVLAMSLTEAAVKVRDAGPGCADEDTAAESIWAGVLPARYAWGEPITAEFVDPGVPVPAHVVDRVGPC